MGYVTGLVVHPNTTLAPNLLYARTDVGGAYRYSAAGNSWVPLMDQYGPLDAGKTRVESIAVDPGNVNTVYVAVVDGDVFATSVVGDILKSTDQGAHWTSTGFTANQVYTGGNDFYRGSSGERLRVDPNNSNVLYFGSRKHGLWSKNGAAAWARVGGGLPATPGDPGYTFVVFDKNSGMTGGNTNTMYVGVYGSGVWRTTNAGSSWSQIGSDTNPLRADVGRDGTLYVTFGGNEAAYAGPGAARKYAGGSWTDITPAAIGKGKSYSGIAVDPANPNNVAVTTNEADMAYSTNKGDSWTVKPVTFASYPAYFWTPGWYKWGTSALVIDPNDATGGRVWMTDGFAVSRTNDFTAAAPSWSTVMKNLEEYCATSIKTPPKVGGAQLFTTQLDGIGNRVADRTVVPTRRYNTVNTSVSAATGLDYCMKQPDYLAYVGHDETNSDGLTGFSNDNGLTWQPFGNSTPGRGGVVAMSATTPQKMAWFPINSTGTGFSYTTNGGSSWSACVGAPSTSWFRSSDYWSGQTLVADRVNGEKFYLLHQNGSGAAEFYVSTNAGANWSKTAASFAGYRSYSVSACIKANPYVEGDLLVTTAANQNVPASSLGDYKLYRSANSGASFDVVPSVVCAYAATFAKGTSATVPAIYIYGRVGTATQEGIYRSVDNAKSWTLISNPDEQRFLGVSYMEGDLLTADLVYIIPGGCRGFMYGTPASPVLTATGAGAEPLQETLSGDLAVYPNPGHGALHLETGHNLAQARFSLVDPVGRVTPLRLSQPTSRGGQLDVSGVAPGVYILRVQTPTTTLTKRVGIQH
jgi:hypothetical protein